MKVIVTLRETEGWKARVYIPSELCMDHLVTHPNGTALCHSHDNQGTPDYNWQAIYKIHYITMMKNKTHEYGHHCSTTQQPLSLNGGSSNSDSSSRVCFFPSLFYFPLLTKMAAATWMVQLVTSRRTAQGCQGQQGLKTHLHLELLVCLCIYCIYLAYLVNYFGWL